MRSVLHLQFAQGVKGYTYREAHVLLEELGRRGIGRQTQRAHGDAIAEPLLIIDDLGMRKLPLTAAEELLEIIIRRYERTSTLLTSNLPVEDWGKLLGDSAAVTAMLTVSSLHRSVPRKQSSWTRICGIRF